MQIRSLGLEDPLEKGIATHSSILAWRILWTEELGVLPSMDYKELDTTEVTKHIAYICYVLYIYTYKIYMYMYYTYVHICIYMYVYIYIL